MKLIYNVKDKPSFSQVIVFAIQQLLAIMAATIAVPAIVGNGMTASAALFGAGAGTIIYLLFRVKNIPVYLHTRYNFFKSFFSTRTDYFLGNFDSISAGYPYNRNPTLSGWG